MTAFSLARRLRAGETVYAAWCSLASPIVAETIAREGFSAVVLDIQHGLWDTASVIAVIGALAHDVCDFCGAVCRKWRDVRQ